MANHSTGSVVRNPRNSFQRLRGEEELVCLFSPLTAQFDTTPTIRIEPGKTIILDAYNLPENVQFKVLRGIEPDLKMVYFDGQSCCAMPQQCNPMTQSSWALDPAKQLAFGVDQVPIVIDKTNNLLALSIPGSYFLELEMNGQDFSVMQDAWLFLSFLQVTPVVSSEYLPASMVIGENT